MRRSPALRRRPRYLAQLCHNARPDGMKVQGQPLLSGQALRVTDAIKRELRRRSAIEPVIGHTKAEHRMGRNFLKGAPTAIAANAGLAAAGYNFRRLLPGSPPLGASSSRRCSSRPRTSTSRRTPTLDARPARLEPPTDRYFTVD